MLLNHIFSIKMYFKMLFSQNRNDFILICSNTDIPLKLILMIPVNPLLTTLSLSCVTDRCSGGECDMEEENLRGNFVRLHQTRLGSSEVTVQSVSIFLFLYKPCTAEHQHNNTPTTISYIQRTLRITFC